MTAIKVIGFCDVEDKPHGDGAITKLRHEDFETVEHALLFDATWREGLRKRVRAKGYYPSKKVGAKDGGRFDPVYVAVGDLPGHGIGGAPTDNRRTTG